MEGMWRRGIGCRLLIDRKKVDGRKRNIKTNPVRVFIELNDIMAFRKRGFLALFRFSEGRKDRKKG